MAVHENGWDDLVWRPGPAGDHKSLQDLMEQDAADSADQQPITSGILQHAARPQPLQGTALGLLMGDQQMADAGIEKGGSSSKSAGPGMTQDPSAQTKPGIEDVAGKIWNAPNTILGLGYGGLGYVAGWPSYWLGLQDKPPGVVTGNNAVQFTNNPLGGVGAITIGNTETFAPDRDHSDNRGDLGPHEEAHTYQGQQLGPFYLPSNILGGAAGLLIDGEWHGQHNWNESGPSQAPPVPWPK
jgi:hypothetical protein